MVLEFASAEKAAPYANLRHISSLIKNKIKIINHKHRKRRSLW